MVHALSRFARVPFATLLLALVLLPAGVGHAASSGPTVKMKDFKFLPAAITIKAGETVTWTYNETIADPMPNCETLHTPIRGAGCPGHSTTSADKVGDKRLWNSGVHYASGFPFSHQFTKPGVYRYYCIPHGGPNDSPLTHMDGVITVK